MAVTNFSPLLGLALPTTGDLSGTWGATVNDSITGLIDSAVAGTTTLSTDVDVTLSTTNGSANQSRNAVLLCTGARTSIKTITAQAQSKAYVVINDTTGGYAVKLVGAGPTTGITVVAGEKALVAWNGSDFVKISSTAIVSSINFGTTGLTPASTTYGPVTVAGTLAVANGGTGLTTVPHTVQVFTSGSGTYTTPANCKAIWIRMVGGGGGGGASSSNSGSAGGTTTFGASLSATGGNGGQHGAGIGGNAGTGGVATGGDLIVTGSTGGAGAKDTGNPTGGMGGNSVFGGASTGGQQSTAGSNALGYGSGGGGGGGLLANLNSAGGGGAGGYLEKTINSPSATYSYAVGAGGAGGSAGSYAGGNGYVGVIIVTEYYV